MHGLEARRHMGDLPSITTINMHPSPIHPSMYPVFDVYLRKQNKIKIKPALPKAID